MKKILLIFVGVVFACGLFAQTLKKHSVPAYLMPGAELKINELKSIVAADKAAKIKASARVNKQTSQAVQMPSVPRIAGTILDASTNGQNLIDTILVTSYDDISYDGDNVVQKTNYVTIEYDKYGYRTKMKEGSQTTYYTYTTDEKGRWLSRKIEIEDENGRRPYSRQERTIENDQVTSVTLYDFDGDRLVKTYYYEIEYRKGSESPIDKEYYQNVAITHEVMYNRQDSSVYLDTKYEWIDSEQCYVMTHKTSPDEKMESEISDEKMIATYYRLDYTSDVEKWFKFASEVRFFGKIHGTITTYYRVDGSEESSYSEIQEGYRDASGDSVQIVYEYLDDRLVPSKKYVMTPDVYAEPDYTRDFNRVQTVYNYVDGEWVVESVVGTKHHLLSNGLSEITQIITQYSRTQTVKAEKEINQYGDVSWNLYPVEVNSDGSFMVTKEKENEYFYCYYLSDGTLEKTIWQTSSKIKNSPIFYVKTASDTEWTILGEFTEVETEGSATLRIVYQTNADGTPNSVTEYITTPIYNNGQEFKSLETLYSYEDNGDYTVNTYEVYSPSDITKLVLMERIERITLSDGTIQITEWEYDEDGKGNVEYASRTEYKDYVTTYYSYKRSTGEWSKSWASCEGSEYVTEDGVIVYINRRLSDDETYAINESKNEHKELRNEDGQPIYTMDANYLWDDDKKQWIGSYKDEGYRYYYTFGFYESNIFNPLDAYDDEYLLKVESDLRGLYEDQQEYRLVSYEWDETQNDWKSNGTRNEFAYELNGDVLKTISTENETNEWERRLKTTTTTIERDSEKRIVRRDEVEDEWKYREGEEDEHSYRHNCISYVYNDINGLLAEEKHVAYTESGEVEWMNIFRYTYTDFTIVSGISAVVEENGTTLTVEGLNVSAPGETIVVYSINGMVVVCSQDKVRLPDQAGDYVVKAGTIVRKVVVK